MKIRVVGVLAMPLLQAATAQAADITMPVAPPALAAPSWYLDGSLSFAHSDNALETPTDKRQDVYANPDIAVGLKGSLPAGFGYQLYTRALTDVFAEVQDANDSFSLVGARLNHNLFGGKAYLLYENRQYYVGAFGPLDFVTNDFKTGMSWVFGKVERLQATPRFSFLFRTSPVAEERQALLDVSVDLERVLSGKWSIVSTPEIASDWYLGGLNTGRQDMRYTASLGIKYAINDSLSLTTSVRYEVQKSSLAGNDFRDFQFGPEFDFSF